MWIIAKNAWRERIRRKELFAVLAVGLLIMMLLSGEDSGLSVNGEAIAGYDSMLPAMHIIINAVVTLLAVILSAGTIPREYSRSTSHLVWIRGISQPEYHGGLLLANCFSVLFVTVLLYIFLGIYMLANGHGGELYRLIPAFLPEAVNGILIASLASVLSIKLPMAVVGLFSGFVAFGGIFFELLGIYRNVIGGIGGKVIGLLLPVLPNLHGIQKQAVGVLQGRGVEMHPIWKGLLILWVILIGLFVFRRREA